MTEEDISPTEWDFERVPDGELVACCYWEYARESAFIRELRQRCWRDHQPVGRPDKQLHTDLQKVQSIGYAANYFLSGFFCPQDGVSGCAAAHAGRGSSSHWSLSKALAVAHQRGTAVPCLCAATRHC